MPKKSNRNESRSELHTTAPARVSKSLWALSLFILLGGIAGVFLYNDYHRTLGQAKPTYVGRAACIECHQQQADLFHGSHHDLAMDLATDETVLANFQDVSIEHFGVTSRLFRDGERFMVHTEGADGEMADFEIKYVFGVEPLQQYMVETKRDPEAAPHEIGQLQVLRLSWDTERKNWFYLKPPDVNEKIEPGDPLHWTGITQRWNSSCADCHSTDVHRNFDDLTGYYRTTFSEIDVSCESCHGPGSTHVELAKNRRIFWDKDLGYGLVKLKTESSQPQIETCAPCHSRRTTTCNGFQAGQRFDDFFACQLLSQQVYHDDGQIRDEDYVYGSFIQSKMYHKGIRCTDCHDPHSAKLIHENNQVCTSCHQHPAGKYDSPNHHFHQAGTPGAACVNCHMAATTYMEVDSRRDHSFRVPRPDLSVQFGTPNACTGCHLETTKLPVAEQVGLTQYLDWIIRAENGNQTIADELKRVDQQMQVAVEKWYPDSNVPKSKYYADLALGKSESQQSLPTLVSLAVDSTAPAIFRASALEELALDRGEQSLDVAVKALEDPDPKVVSAAMIRIGSEVARLAEYSAYQGGNLAEFERRMRPLIKGVVRLCDHSARRVRIEAARLSANFPPSVRDQVISSSERTQMEQAIREYKSSLKVENDRAGNHMMLGELYRAQNDDDSAVPVLQDGYQD